jgi:hypothetical protein
MEALATEEVAPVLVHRGLSSRGSARRLDEATAACSLAPI